MAGYVDISGVELRPQTQLTAGASFAFADLPTPSLGMMAVVSDSNTVTWGATIAGGGANAVLAWYNGTNWTVIGA